MKVRGLIMRVVLSLITLLVLFCTVKTDDGKSGQSEAQHQYRLAGVRG